jgi:putative glutamine amidotransferase
MDVFMNHKPTKPDIVRPSAPERPLIGVPCFTHDIPDKSHPFFSVRSTYIEALRQSGGSVFLIPTRFCEASLRNLYEIADGIMIPGGTDISPAHYGGKYHPALQPPDKERDLVELSLVKWALADKKPLLGICRGMQMINIACGGTLVPDLCELRRATHWPGEERNQEDGWNELAHDISIVSDSLLYRLVGKTSLRINSLHHQCIGILGKSLYVSAASDDDTPEAIELNDRNAFVLGIQGHPETLCHSIAPVWRNCFDGFIRASILWKEKVQNVLATNKRQPKDKSSTDELPII